MTVRVRFAPSPTGFLHVGGARTALFNYLFAKHHQGEFLLRIEDTDLERSTPESVQAILEGMSWLGLAADGPIVHQTQRFARYQEVAGALLASGHAYRCACSKERLEALRAQQMQDKQKPRYDGHCRDQRIPEDVPHVIRFKNPTEGEVCFNDLVHGEIRIQNKELDDFVLMRADGSPTYNFTVVVDDWDMQITHVIRGDDHINNTPRQCNVLTALGASIPQYAHLPMILGDDGKRLSKRHGAVSVMQYQRAGYLPEALRNYLVRLGWSAGDQELFSLAEMIQQFDLAHVSKSAAAFNTSKLDWVNQQYIKAMSVQDLAPLLQKQLQSMQVDTSQGPDVVQVATIMQDRAKTLVEMASSSAHWYQEDITYDQAAVEQHLNKHALPILVAAQKAFSVLEDWQLVMLGQRIKQLVKDLGLRFPQVAQPLRVALTGSTQSPSIDATVYLLGKHRTLARLQKVIEP